MTATVPGTGPDTALSEADLDSLLLIRHVEQALLGLFAAGELSGTTHTCLGQEYVPVALAPLVEGDFVLSNHRGHGHYLAHCADPDGLLSEVLGREGALCSGVGGSQHLYRDGYLSTGVQGESLPVATGIALHFRRTGARRLAVVYVGDGTLGEGGFYEGLNMAALWRLPVVVVVEHNGIAQSTPSSRQLAGTVAGRAAAFGVAYEHVTGHDLTAIRRQLAQPVAAVRDGDGPLLIEVDTVRLGPHSKGDDTRDQAELDRLRDRDWYPAYGAALGDRFAAADARARARVDALVAEVLSRPLSRWVR